MNRNVVDMDIKKQVFHLFMMRDGKVIKQKLTPSELLGFILQLSGSMIALEAVVVRTIKRDYSNKWVSLRNAAERSLCICLCARQQIRF